MLRRAFMAVATVSSLLIADVAVAQDGGIWAARPRPRRIVKHTAPADPLQGLANGQVVRTIAGRDLGTVSQIITAENGSIRTVIVTSSTGQMFHLSPSKLSMSGGVVIATDTDER
jgi:sporulation protein YlmC with PRC-barrel domain